jgi:hypothetical protein
MCPANYTPDRGTRHGLKIRFRPQSGGASPTACGGRVSQRAGGCRVRALTTASSVGVVERRFLQRPRSVAF